MVDKTKDSAVDSLAGKAGYPDKVILQNVKRVKDSVCGFGEIRIGIEHRKVRTIVVSESWKGF